MIEIKLNEKVIKLNIIELIVLINKDAFIVVSKSIV